MLNEIIPTTFPTNVLFAIFPRPPFSCRNRLLQTKAAASLSSVLFRRTTNLVRKHLMEKRSKNLAGSPGDVRTKTAGGHQIGIFGKKTPTASLFPYATGQCEWFLGPTRGLPRACVIDLLAELLRAHLRGL